MNIEVLYFARCPSYETLLPRLRDLVVQAGGDPAVIALRSVESIEAAKELRFLGSPTVRVNGRDVDPGAGGRGDFGLKCRIYRPNDGQTPVPPDTWIRDALAAARP